MSSNLQEIGLIEQQVRASHWLFDASEVHLMARYYQRMQNMKNITNDLTDLRRELCEKSACCGKVIGKDVVEDVISCKLRNGALFTREILLLVRFFF